MLHKNALYLKDKSLLYIELTRLNRPVGILLLLWPTLSALWLAAQGKPNLHLVIIFATAVALMRSAGCIINDIADRHLDRKVKRTQNRPLALKKMTVGEALAVFMALLFFAFCLVLLTNRLTIQLSLIALALACTYPLMKRVTHFPQVVLGLAFGMGIPMAFSAQQNQVPMLAWIMFVSTVLWTIAYDTIYAMMDREDDLRAGIKSTAILFGRQDRMIIAILQGLTVFGFFLAGQHAGLSDVYYIGLLVMLGLFAWQQWLIQTGDTAQCQKAFGLNAWAGASLYVSLVLHYLA